MAVAELRAALVKTSKSAVVPVQTGIGGVGKTTLAKHYAKVYAAKYDRIEFLRASSEQELMADLAALAKRLQPELDESAGTKALAIHARDLIAERAAGNTWLLIFDNVEKPQLMLDWMIRARHLHMIVTSRFPDWQADGFEAKPLGVLSDSAALELLRSEAGRDGAGFPQLVNDLDRLPLALVHAGEWLRTHPQRSASDYLKKIDHLKERLEIPGVSSQEDRTTAAVVELTLQGLGKDARALANVMAWLAPDRIEMRLFGDLVGLPWLSRFQHPFVRTISRRIWRVSRDEMRLRAAFSELRTSALLEEDPDRKEWFRMHRVFQQVIRAEGAANGQPSFSKANGAAALLAGQFPAKTSPVNAWPTCRRLVPHVQALWAAAEPLWRGDWGKPGWAAMDYLLNQSGIFLSVQHDLPAAIDAKRGSLALTEARLGEEDRDVPLALGNLALDLADTGAFAEAQDYIDRAVALNERYRTGAARADLAGSYMQQASLGFRRMRAGGQVAEGAEAMAEVALDKAREIWAELSGEDSAEMSNWWNELGYLRRLQGRKGAQFQAYGRALQILRALPQADRGDLAIYAMNYGGTALELGRAEEALGALQEAYDIAAEIFAEAPNHGFYVACRQWHISCLFVLARKGQNTHAQAEALCAKHGLDFAEREAVAELLPLEPVPLDDHPPNPSD